MKPKTRLLAIVLSGLIAVFLLTALLLYFQLHGGDNHGEHGMRSQGVHKDGLLAPVSATALRTRAKLSRFEIEAGQRKRLSVAMVTNPQGLQLHAKYNETFSDGHAYISQGTLILLDMLNGVSTGDALVVEVLFPVAGMLALPMDSFDAHMHFVSLSGASTPCRDDFDTGSSRNLTDFLLLKDYILLEHIRDPHTLPPLKRRAASHMRIDTDLSIGSWHQQLPLSNGLMGAMVGGTHNHDVIPVSLAHLFAYDRQPADYTEVHLPPDLLQQARKELLVGNRDGATHLMGQFQSAARPLGMLQGAADLVLVFPRSDDNNHSEAAVPPSSAAPRDRPVRVARPVLLHPPSVGAQGRRAVVERLLHDVGMEGSGATAHGQDDVLLARGSLDLRAGLASEVHLTVAAAAGGASPASVRQVRWHTREHFMDERYEVLITQLGCQVILSSASSVLVNRSTADPACLRAVVALRRDQGEGRSVEPQLSSSKSSDAFQLDLWARASDTVVVPAFHICAQVRCLEGSAWLDETHHFVRCENSLRMTIVTASAMQDSLGLSPAELVAAQSDELGDNLRQQCTAKLRRVEEVGVDAVRRQHLRTFSAAMARFQVRDLTFASSSPVPAESGQPEEPEVSDATMAGLSSALLHYAHYLARTQFTRRAPTLQGHLAEGLNSVWAGDFHFNINIQMQYWAAASLGMREALNPLLDLLGRAARSGVKAAGDYGMPGWVVHGFTDSSLSGGLLGDQHWALCPTCGAWLACQAFDMAMHEPDPRPPLSRLLPVLSGAALFLDRYLFADGDVLVTGPATSPENSYRIAHPGKSCAAPVAGPAAKPGAPAAPIMNSHYLALAPAIDSSVLRHLCSALRITAQLLNNEEDAVLASNLCAKVQRLPHKGLPTVHSTAGTIAEYPHHPGDVCEDLDPGHRHFSPLHWVYPQPFPPHTRNATRRRELRQAVLRHLQVKRAAAGGHTGWSAAWEAALHARLASPLAVQSLRRMVGKYFAANLLALHPPLKSMGIEGCHTCFSEDETVAGRKHHARFLGDAVSALLDHSSSSAGPALGPLQSGRRTFALPDNSVFQLDGNMGAAAALLEIMVVTPHPGVISFLPAAAAGGLHGGEVRGIVLKGAVGVAMGWRQGELTFVHMSFSTPAHPWLRLAEDSEDTGAGLYRLTHRAAVTVYSPSPLRLASEHLDRGHVPPRCATLRELREEELEQPWGLGEAGLAYALELEPGREQPCEVLLCGADLAACVQAASQSAASAQSLAL